MVTTFYKPTKWYNKWYKFDSLGIYRLVLESFVSYKTPEQYTQRVVSLNIRYAEGLGHLLHKVTTVKVDIWQDASNGKENDNSLPSKYL